MLVLSRKVGERIYIADNIELTIVGVQGGRLRLGISAPENVSIHRAEVQQRVNQERAAAGLSTVPPSLSIDGATTCP